ncbi:biotin-dependent carboxyltransferase family protein [Chitinibacter bivalviorum]|uniref:Biotin-dependent carboxyltransferase family protein n=1 Tax=Chitinibacter bivalviorum TaxID=2739434 RepID=A0A7H9BEE7_9NEIS|nr:biotin-dependent carboxyltransferase family protein [Chitinibacter bivalviorum]QLG86907.1 biotin-dependent carboxyltransferase family protein [Chitinibacter bivalviorum]
MKPLLRILKAGLQTTVQDLGRPQGASWGLPVGGAADGFALQLANLMLGNPLDAAVLEITLGGFQAQFEQTSSFALAGANCQATLDGQLLLPNAVYRGVKGQVLRFMPPEQGVRSYLALPGGIDVPLLWGSRSTLLASKIGGFAGRALKKGDVLSALRRDKSRSPCAVAMPERGELIRFLPGPQWLQLGAEGQKLLTSQAWQVDIHSNRMGLKINASKLFMDIPMEMSSHAVMAGTIQLPPNGQPIILLSDAQVTGGYPVVGQVIQADLWRLGQLRAGESIHLFAVSEDNALDALARQQAWFKRVASALAAHSL